jgi:small-conductance mechanosensitive channel
MDAVLFRKNLVETTKVVGAGAAAVAAVLGALQLYKLSQREPSDDVRTRRDHGDPTKITVAQTAASVICAIIVIATLSAALRRAGVSTESTVGVAAVVTLVLALATQSLAKEIVGSVVFMYEGRAAVGDSVAVQVSGSQAQIAGRVAKIGISSIAIRRADNSIVHVPFSSIIAVANESENDQIAIVDIPFDHTISPAQAVADISAICDSIRDDENICHSLQGSPYVAGIYTPHPNYFVIAIRVPCREHQKVPVENYVRLLVMCELRARGAHPPRVALVPPLPIEPPAARIA